MSWDTVAIATTLSLSDLRNHPLSSSTPRPPSPALTSTPTQQHLKSGAKPDSEGEGERLLDLIDDARSRNYFTVCAPLTNEKWKERWMGMCLIPPANGHSGGGNGSGDGKPPGEEDGMGEEEAKKKEAEILVEKQAEAWRAAPGFLKEEVTMTSLDEADGVIVMVSDWLELDAADDWVRHDSEIALRQELAYASYLNIQTVILPPPRNRDQAASYGRALNACLAAIPYIQLSVRLPIYDPSIFQRERHQSTHPQAPQPPSQTTPQPQSPQLPQAQAPPQRPRSQTVQQLQRQSKPFGHQHRRSLSKGLGSISYTKISESPTSSYFARSATPEIKEPTSSASAASAGTGTGIPSTKAPEAELNATWEIWDVVRAVCGYNPRLTLTLDLTPPLPSAAGVLDRWAAEPIRHVFLPASTFIANSKGYPVLPKVSQTFVRDIMKHRPMVILSDAGAGLHSSGGEPAYLQYIRHLEKTSPAVMQAKTAGTVENFAQGYQDYLQAPLQPLMDNLQSVTYQTFEQDPVKYQKYEEAVFQALDDWPEADRIVLYVAGAGRGGIVARCLTAIKRSKRNVFVYALEKNPSAFVTLQGRKQNEWRDKVELVYGDMRMIQVPEPGDIIVSELLGSFGDNELSPECLDGAMRFLKPEGISIPASYSAYLAPLSSSKLYNEVRAGKDPKACETPFVVMFQAVNILSGDGGGEEGRCGPKVQECWDFEHPRRDAVLNEQGLPLTNSHNARSAKLTFHIPHAGVLHGFAGYFEAMLYGDVGLSIHPLRKDQISKDMLSWFPLFFPLKDPLYLPSNSELQVSLWRLTNARQVWYEWYAESFLPVYRPRPPPSDPISQDPLGTPRIDGRGSFIATPSTPLATPSPLIDAIDNPFVTMSPSMSGSGSGSRLPESLRRKGLGLRISGSMGGGIGSAVVAAPGSDGSEESVKGSEGGLEAGVVKIGQTALHNPGGQSSWIGL